MGIVEERIFSNLAIPPSIYCHYVDDIFILVHSDEDLQELKNAFINNSSLNLSCEGSDGGKLPFLDIKVLQNDGFLKLKCF